MQRSMYSAISGLQGHQQKLDVTSDNIANVNTPGFKRSRVSFDEALAQTRRGGGLPGAALGGINPGQIGLGVNAAWATKILSQGPTQRTERTTDLAIQGEGYFVMEGLDGQVFTRAGAFFIDAEGSLVDGGGNRVLGFPVDDDGIVLGGGPEPVVLPVNAAAAPSVTTEIRLTGNLDALADVGDTVSTTISVFDAVGAARPVDITFTRTAGAGPGDVDFWAVTVTGDTGAVELAGELVFPGPTNQVGQDFTFDPSVVLDDYAAPPGGDPVSFAVGNLTGNAGMNSVQASGQDGAAAGQLVSFDVGDDGVVVGRFDNGIAIPLAAVALATFDNPEALERLGGSTYQATGVSGDPVISGATMGASGRIVSGALEMSNVDLTEEFTDLILAQRGFQANARVVTATDDTLQEVVNLAR